jgi:CRISPR-associated protein Cmr6
MRNDLAHFKTSHAGLLLERLVPDLSDTTQKPEKIATLIKTVEDWDGGDLYRDAFRLFRARLQKLPNIVLKELSVTDRIIVGLGVENPMETSITLNRLYGVPVIPGSALKGVARRYAEMFAPEEEDKTGDYAKQVQFLFGDRDFGGRITFFDAWWVPGEPPLCKDVITVHHQQYYTTKGEKPPTDFDDPNPVSFVSAKGAFLFAVQGPTQEWSQLAMVLLQGGLCHLGVGAKTSSGYGRFWDDTAMLGSSTQSAGQASSPEPLVDPSNMPDEDLKTAIESLSGEYIKKLLPKFADRWHTIQSGRMKRQVGQIIKEKSRISGVRGPWLSDINNFLQKK